MILDAKKTAKYFFDASQRASHLDTIIVCALLEHPECSPTDLQEIVFGVRRGGSVDAALARLVELGLIIIREPDEPSQYLRRIIEWTTAGEKWLKTVTVS